MRSQTVGLILAAVAAVTGNVAHAQVYSSVRDLYTVEFDPDFGGLCVAKSEVVNVRTGEKAGFSGAMMGRDGFVFVHSHDEWDGLADRDIQIALQFSNGRAFGGTARLLDGTVLYSPRTDELGDFMEAWAYSHKVTLLTTKGHSYPFQLNGTAAAWDALVKCWTAHFGDPFDDDVPPSNTRTNPF